MSTFRSITNTLLMFLVGFNISNYCLGNQQLNIWIVLLMVLAVLIAIYNIKKNVEESGNRYLDCEFARYKDVLGK